MRAALLAALALAACADLGPTPGAAAYLERELWPGSTGRTAACAVDPLGRDDGRAYVWALCREVGREPAGGVSVPVVLRLQGGAVVGHEVPRDGAAYGPDLERLFPASVRRRMRRGRDARIQALVAAADARAATLGAR